MSRCTGVKRGLRHVCAMSPWMFSIYINGVLGMVRSRMQERGVRTVERDLREWVPSRQLSADVTALKSKLAEQLQCTVRKFGRKRLNPKWKLR